MDVQGSTRMSVERGFFLSTMNPRWKTDAWPSTEIQAGDLQSAKATNFCGEDMCTCPQPSTRRVRQEKN